jgi:hypothetical protein
MGVESPVRSSKTQALNQSQNVKKLLERQTQAGFTGCRWRDGRVAEGGGLLIQEFNFSPFHPKSIKLKSPCHCWQFSIFTSSNN